MVRPSALLCGVLLATSSVQSAAAAPSKARQCIEASNSAVSLHEAGKLLDARTKLTACAIAACPGAVRTACEKQLQELNAAIPTIVFEPKDGAGQDLSSVNVAIDDQPPTALTGSAIELDPGDHRFTFTVAGQPPVSATFGLHEGDKGRRERVTIGAPPPPPRLAPSEPEAKEEAAPASRSKSTAVPALGIATGSLGIVGLGVGSAFGLLAFTEKSKQIADCTQTGGCNNRTQAGIDQSHERTDSTVSTVAFVAGGALVAAGATLLLVGRTRSESKPTTGLLLVPSVAPGGGAMFLRGEF